MSFSEEWKELFLNDLVEILNHKRIPLSSRVRIKKQGIFPYYGASGIVDYIDEYIFDGDYVLISEDGENLRSRNTPIAFQTKGKFWVNNHAHILKGRKSFINEFVVYYFKYLNVAPYITGAVQPKLNKSNLLSIPIKTPPHEILIKIVSILSTLDKKIALLRQQNDTLEAIAQTLFKEWFVKFEFPDANGQPYRSSGGELVSSELGDVPLGWDCKKIGDFVDTISDTYKFDNKEEIIFLNTSDVLNGFVLHHKYSKTKGLPGQAKKKIRKDDILYSEIRPKNKRFAYIDFEADEYVVSTKLMVLRSKGLLDNIFIYFYLTRPSVIKELHQMAEARSGTFPQITFSHLASLDIIIPNNYLLEKFINIIKPTYLKIYQNAKEIETLTNLRDTLLPKLMSGKLRVN